MEAEIDTAVEVRSLNHCTPREVPVHGAFEGNYHEVMQVRQEAADRGPGRGPGCEFGAHPFQ